MARIIYIHVPKCGGSSFAAALRLRYLASQATITLGQGDQSLEGEARIESDYAARSQELHQLVARGKRLISGHVRYDSALHEGPARGYRFVTLLRDPVARFVSHYNYLQRAHPDAGRPATLAAFLDGPDAPRLASQYLYYFAGAHQGRVRDLPAATARAITHLRRFDLIGDLSAPDAFARELQGLTRLPVLRWRRNAAPRPTHIPTALRSRIEALCAPDIAIYEAVRSQRMAAA